MRNKPEPEQMTRPLIQKPIAFAELEENARIAVSVLADDGWRVERVETDLRIRVTADVMTAIDHIDTNASLAERTRVAELRFAALRQQGARDGTDQWFTMAVGCFICGIFAWFGLPNYWDFILAGLGMAVWKIARKLIERKEPA